MRAANIIVHPTGIDQPPSLRWISSRPAFLLPVRVLGRLIRRLFVARLRRLHDGKLAFFGSLAPLADRRAFLRYLAPARKKRWVVYAKPPFAGPEAVLAYLSRYTHRVAISTNRLIRFDGAGVSFRYKALAPPIAIGTSRPHSRHDLRLGMPQSCPAASISASPAIGRAQTRSRRKSKSPKRSDQTTAGSSLGDCRTPTGIRNSSRLQSGGFSDLSSLHRTTTANLPIIPREPKAVQDCT